MVKSTKKTRLAIVGASVRAAAQSALRAGFDVVGADLFADADLDGVCPVTKIGTLGEAGSWRSQAATAQQTQYPEGLADWLAEQDVDAWMYTGALENYPDLVDRMAQIAPLWGVGGEPLRRCRDPLVLQEVFREAGVAFPETRPTGEVPRGDPGWLAKSYRHSAGAGVFTLTNPDSWDRAEREDDYLQQHLPGESLAVIYAVGPNGSGVLGSTKQILGRGDLGWSYRGSVVASPFSSAMASRGKAPQLMADLVAIGEVLASRLGLVGIVGVDLLRDDDHLTVVEINPRWTASVEVLESSFLRNAILSHASACREGRGSPWHATAHHLDAKEIVYADRDLEVPDRFTSWARDQGHADLPRPGTRIEKGQPVCTVFAEGADEQAARTQLKQRVGQTLQRLHQPV